MRNSVNHISPHICSIFIISLLTSANAIRTALTIRSSQHQCCVVFAKRTGVVQKVLPLIIGWAIIRSRNLHPITFSLVSIVIRLPHAIRGSWSQTIRKTRSNGKPLDRHKIQISRTIDIKASVLGIRVVTHGKRIDSFGIASESWYTIKVAVSIAQHILMILIDGSHIQRQVINRIKRLGQRV